MKLKLIAAAALVGWAGVAHAQSSVTLYGIIDSGMLYQSSSAATFAPNAPNTGKIYRFKDGGIYSSIWGIRGSEDIGGGYNSGIANTRGLLYGYLSALHLTR